MGIASFKHKRLIPVTKVLVFDSGVGGLSIWEAIKTVMPKASYDYIGDSAFFPYGTKTEQALLERVKDVLDAAVPKFNPDVIVVACNTISTIVLPMLRTNHKVPIVGVVPAIKPAAEQSQTKCIGLLATPGTIHRTYTDNLINEFAADCTVVRVGSSDLVHLAEAKLRGETLDPERLKAVLQPFHEAEQKLGRSIDAIVLGCTHFPWVRDDLSAAYGKSIAWIDSGSAVARRVLQVLGNSAKDSINPAYHAWFTKVDADVMRLKNTLQKLGFSKIKEFSP